MESFKNMAIEEKYEFLNSMSKADFSESTCLSILSDRIEFIKFIPSSVYTDQLSRMILEKFSELGGDHTFLDLLQFIPKNLRTDDICLLAISQYPLNIKHVPTNLLNEHKILMALYSEYKNILKLVPDVYKTDKICHIAVSCNSSNWDCTPLAFRCLENAIEMVKKNPKSLDVLSSEFQTPQMCLSALDYQYNYVNVKICKNPDYATTKANLEEMVRIDLNRTALKNKIEGL